MKYRIVLEFDPATRQYTALVPGLPGLVVDARSEREALKLAKEGIRFYLKELAGHRPSRGSKPAKPLPSKVVTVDV